MEPGPQCGVADRQRKRLRRRWRHRRWCRRRGRGRFEARNRGHGRIGRRRRQAGNAFHSGRGARSRLGGRAVQSFPAFRIRQQIRGRRALLFRWWPVVGDAIGIHRVVNRADTRGKGQRQGGAGGRKQKAKWAGHNFVYVILVGDVNAGWRGKRKFLAKSVSKSI